MKLQTLVQKLLCCVLALSQAYAQTDTLDLTQSVPLPKTSQVNTTPWTGKDNKTLEFGIGYINTSFRATQSVIGNKGSTDSRAANGIEIFLNANYYFGQRYGGIIGLGVEFIPIAWKEPLGVLTDFTGDISTVKFNKEDFLMTQYLQVGGFYDVYQSNSAILRLSATAGVNLNWLFGDSYQGETTVSFLGPNYTAPSFFSLPTIGIPLTFGLRYNFKRVHNIELAFKLHLLDIKKTLEWGTKSDKIKFNTDITRKSSIGVRYVYEFDTWN